MTIDFPEDLLQLERSAWDAHRQGALTIEQAAAVQAGVTAFAEASGLDRYEVEMGLKRAVRHPEPAED
ncbi:hypothetical protein ACH4UM_24080 [Streptomyces sp. NPDC020801]|uniref:hypothetical protein n=1 Tax=unclassified Streptomyces TaxID=2593676 RepID=UPI003798301A